MDNVIFDKTFKGRKSSFVGYPKSLNPLIIEFIKLFEGNNIKYL